MVRVLFLVLLFSQFLSAQKFTKDDTLRGSIGPARAWWDLKFYHLNVSVNPKGKSIAGSNLITYDVLHVSQVMQIDLQEPMLVDSIIQNGKQLSFDKDGANALMIKLVDPQIIGQKKFLKVYFHGKPKVAVRAPWDGGFSWSKDKFNRPFVATSCQNLGASVWWPCKDHMYDEVDSMRITVTAPDSLYDVSNGKLVSSCTFANGNITNEWLVKNPINNYGVNVNLGRYVRFAEKFKGEKGDLDCSYYVLPENLEKAKLQFKDAERTLRAFEHWFGPYPFYEDGYKLVEVPYLGMEHQSSVTYGNQYANGYLGRDLSGTGWGLKWDFIIVHESGHEWFANNITYSDIADMWIHESFTNYSETLFTEYHYGKQAGQDYVIGTRKNIKNDKSIIGIYDVNHEGSGDMYYKGGNMIHTIRHVINDDEKFRAILRGLNKEFYHQTVTSAQIENYISQQSKIDFSTVFDQYLRTIQVPIFKTRVHKKQISYRFENTVAGFNLPLRVSIDGKEKWLNANTEWQKISGKNMVVDRNFYVEQR